MSGGRHPGHISSHRGSCIHPAELKGVELKGAEIEPGHKSWAEVCAYHDSHFRILRHNQTIAQPCKPGRVSTEQYPKGSDRNLGAIEARKIGLCEK
jgi:hypothetical protein